MEQKTTDTSWLAIVGYLASIVITVAAIVVGLPLLFAISPNKLTGFAAMIMLVPLLPAMQSILQGEQPPSLKGFWKVYWLTFIYLFMELAFLALIMPLIVIELAGVIVGLVIVALVIGQLLFLFQYLTGIDIGIIITTAEALKYFYILLGLSVLEGLYLLLNWKVLKQEERFFDLVARSFERVEKLFR